MRQNSPLPAVYRMPQNAQTFDDIQMSPLAGVPGAKNNTSRDV